MRRTGVAARALSAIFVIATLELFLGGGGRLLEIGPITLRMLLFALMMLVVATVILARPGLKGDFAFSIVLVLMYCALHMPAAINGVLAGVSVENVLSDMQPTFYWAAAPFFALALADRTNIERARKLVLASGAVLAVTYLGTLLALALGYLDPVELWLRLVETGEFFFRNDFQFFYKGHLYLGIAIVFLLAMPRKRPWLLILITIALLLTLTRGFILASSLTAFLMFAMQRRWRALASMFLLIAVLVMAAAGISRSEGEEALGVRGESDSQRIGDIRYMVNQATPKTLLIGEGFGTLINERMNIETTYFWLLWKAGLPSLVFWLSPLAICLMAFREIGRRSRNFPLATAFMFGVVFVYVQTATNPYLNNPIGLSFVLIALFSLRHLAREERVGSRVLPKAHRPVAMTRTTSP